MLLLFTTLSAQATGVHARSEVDRVVVARDGHRGDLWECRRTNTVRGVRTAPAGAASLASVDLTFDQGGLDDRVVLADSYAVVSGSLDPPTMGDVTRRPGASGGSGR